jgi:hypothetical protein
MIIQDDCISRVQLVKKFKSASLCIICNDNNVTRCWPYKRYRANTHRKHEQQLVDACLMSMKAGPPAAGANAAGTCV